MDISWGLAGGGNNALQMFQVGAQMGQQVNDRREQRTQQNALLAQRQQQFDLERQKFDAGRIDAQTKAQQEQLEAGRNAIGQAAFDLYQTPPDQRAAKWDAYVQRFNMPDLMGQYSDQRLNEIVAQAGLQEKFQAFQRPDYQAVPYDSTLVNTRDPNAVAAFAGGTPLQQGAQQQAAPQQAGAAPESFTGAQIRANIQSMGAAKAVDWMRRNNIMIQVENEGDYSLVPNGFEYIAPDGTRRRKGGQ